MTRGAAAPIELDVKIFLQSLLLPKMTLPSSTNQIRYENFLAVVRWFQWFGLCSSQSIRALFGDFVD
jgi:hypothetical protein